MSLYSTASFDGFFDGIRTLMVIFFVSLPLAIWKLIDLLIMLYMFLVK